ncbi:MAG: AAA family ATPase, partial [Planctomycetales bacterium]|nr:AAA family ATPase [Planctomycetales bacterium]
AACLLADGVSVVLDGVYSRGVWRQAAREAAARYGAEALAVVCACPDDMALERICSRYAAGQSLSDARPELFARQKEHFETPPPDDDCIWIDTGAAHAAGVAEVLARLGLTWP